MNSYLRVGQHFRYVLSTVGVAVYLLCSHPGHAAEAAPQNLALQAQASAFEEYQGMRAGLANDGRLESRWSGIPGHNIGGWFELDWAQPVRVGEVIVFQHDRYVKEMDLQVWDSTNQVWVTLGLAADDEESRVHPVFPEGVENPRRIFR